MVVQTSDVLPSVMYQQYPHELV